MASVSAYLRQNVLGLVAIFLALNAGAYAVTTTGDESAKTVFNEDLANSSVDSRVLAAGAVAGPDIQAAAVGPKKMKLDKLVKFLQTRVNAQCPDGQTVQGILADGGVLCAVDDVNPGTITGVTTSNGLTGGGTSGSVNVGVDPSAIQSRVTGNCIGNQAVQSVAQNGGVGCSTITANGAAGGDLTGTYPNPTLGNGSIDSTNLFTAGLQDGAAGTPTLRSLGTGAAQAAAGNDPRLSDARTPTGSAGGDLSGTYPNPDLGSGVVAADNFATLPGGKIRQTPACQTFPTSVFQKVRFDNLQFGSDVTFDDANDQLVLDVSGRYVVYAEAIWASNATSVRAISLVHNGSEVAFDSRDALAGTETVNNVSTLIQANAGDTLELDAAQDSGGDLALSGTFGGRCASLAVQWVGP